MSGLRSSIRFSDVEVRPAARELLLGGRPAQLGARAFDILLALIERNDRVVSKHELLDLIWPGVVVEENNLQVHISNLRKLLGPHAIATVPGRGYRFTAMLDDASSGTTAEQFVVRPSGAPAALSNLPAHLPAIFGRDDDVRNVLELLRRHELVSLVGAGGIGKTRLALEVAATQRGAFADGVWWVDLAAVSTPALVANVVAQTLGIAATEQRPVVQALESVLSEHDTLIVFDNCEHVLDVVSTLTETLLRHCSRLRLLITSQETLKVPGEQVYRVPTLAVPSEGESVDPVVGAIALFVARAKEADPRAVFDDSSLQTVAAICRALDGIPLAIEMAAARMPLLGVEGLYQRLNERFQLLSGHARKALRRHQTLRAALEWSHGLLSESEQAVFRRLGVFSGGFPLEMAQAVAADSQNDAWAVLDLLGHLVDKSLVVAEGTTQPRYRLLESMHAYALEHLATAGETALILRCHAQALYDYLLPLHSRRWLWTATAAERRLGSAELDNLRSALDWAESPQGDRSLGQALMGVSLLVWTESGQLVEGFERCRRLLPVHGLAPATEAHFQLTFAALGAATVGHDVVSAVGRAIELFRTLDEDGWLADALILRARIGWRRGEDAEVTQALDEAERLVGPGVPARQHLALLTARTGYHCMRDDLEAALVAARRQVACAQEDKSMAFSMTNVAVTEALLGHYQEAIDRLTGVLAKSGEVGPVSRGHALGALACCYALRNERGDLDLAMEHGRDAWKLLHRAGPYTWLLFNMALVACRRGAFESAALTLGYVDAAWASVGEVPYPYLQRLRNEIYVTICNSLGEERTKEMLMTGGALSNKRAAEVAFGIA